MFVVAVLLLVLGAASDIAQRRDPRWKDHRIFGGHWPSFDDLDRHDYRAVVEAKRGAGYILGRFCLFLGSVLFLLAVLGA